MTALLSEPAPSTPALDCMTKSELLDYAADHGVEGVSSAMRKAEIIEAIEAVTA